MKMKIAEVLIDARCQADKILEDANIKAVAEKERIELQTEAERKILEGIRQDVSALKKEIHSKLKTYEGQLDEILNEEGNYFEEKT